MCCADFIIDISECCLHFLKVYKSWKLPLNNIRPLYLNSSGDNHHCFIILSYNKMYSSQNLVSLCVCRMQEKTSSITSMCVTVDSYPLHSPFRTDVVEKGWIYNHLLNMTSMYLVSLPVAGLWFKWCWWCWGEHSIVPQQTQIQTD